jgi:two-component system nitrogen regulation sensor histidine kinase NtrY
MSNLSGFTIPPKKHGSRTRRYIFGTIVFLVLSLIAINTFLHISHPGNPRFIPMTVLVYTATLVVVLALLILATILGRNLIKLYFERRSGQLGSGFKTKIVSTFIALSLLPALLLFLLAYSLISASIEQWFRAPDAQMMENSRVLAQQYYAEAEQRAEYYAENIASRFNSVQDLYPGWRPRLRERLKEFRQEYALDNVQVFDRHARLTMEAGSAVSTNDHEAIKKQLIAQAMLGQSDFQVERLNPEDPLNEISWAVAPIRDSEGAVIGTILTETLHPQSAKFRVDSVMQAYDTYIELQREKYTLRFNTLLMLVLATLLIIFAFSWFALYLSRRITEPIQALAHGAAAVATGNLAYRVDCQAFDELGNLVASFNRMTSDLQENEKRIKAAQESLRLKSIEHADRRRYIETILQTIATGVISLDGNYRIRTINRAAVQMLGVGKISGEAKLGEIVPAPAFEAIKGLLNKSAILGTVVRNIELTFQGKSLQLAATVTPFAETSGQGTGWVVVLDDMTELLRMEKMSAWQEVARRMAHEIKNPLTPIQLSAERILRRYKRLGPSLQKDASRPEFSEAEFSRFDQILTECIQVIIQEASSLKNLVDEFSRFARLPEIRLEKSDLNDVLENTLNLYNGRISDINVRKELDRSIPKLQLDPEQMKRVFINLFDNALEAMADHRYKKVLHLRTRRNAQQGCVSVEIGDTGRGFPEEYQDSLFLPYFSTRKGGTGLGLAIVRQIVSDHSGNVRAEANIPVGTRIIIDLPLAQN